MLTCVCLCACACVFMSITRQYAHSHMHTHPHTHVASRACSFTTRDARAIRRTWHVVRLGNLCQRLWMDGPWALFFRPYLHSHAALAELRPRRGRVGVVGGPWVVSPLLYVLRLGALHLGAGGCGWVSVRTCSTSQVQRRQRPRSIRAYRSPTLALGVEKTCACTRTDMHIQNMLAPAHEAP